MNLNPTLHVLGLWEEAGENPCRHRKNKQTPNGKKMLLCLIGIGLDFSLKASVLYEHLYLCITTSMDNRM